MVSLDCARLTPPLHTDRRSGWEEWSFKPQEAGGWRGSRKGSAPWLCERVYFSSPCDSFMTPEFPFVAMTADLNHNNGVNLLHFCQQITIWDYDSTTNTSLWFVQSAEVCEQRFQVWAKTATHSFVHATIRQYHPAVVNMHRRGFCYSRCSSLYVLYSSCLLSILPTATHIT